jgi:thiol-disulfide isomerase/thioredoxin
VTEPLGPGESAPEIPGADLDDPTLLFFYKVTCPVCQLAAPVAQQLQDAYPGRVVGVGQDPAPELAAFASRHGMTIPTVQDEPPYELSEAYGCRVVPTLFLVDGGIVQDVAESWDRDGYNRLSHGLAELIGADASTVSTPGDGLPSFRPG